MEPVIIVLIFFAVWYLPLWGKEYAALSEPMQKRVQSIYKRYEKRANFRLKKSMTIDMYTHRLAKQGLACLIIALALLPLYGLIFYWVFFT